MSVGVPTSTTNINSVYNIDGFASLNCVYGFDLATENSMVQGSKLVSDEIVFSNRVLTIILNPLVIEFFLLMI